MATLREAVGKFKAQHEPRREVISGWMADPTGYGDPIVRDETTGDPTGYYYCMIDRGDGTNSGDVIKVWGGGIRPVAGWPVLIGTTRERPWELSILSIDKEAMGGGIDKYVMDVPPHHETHEWGDPSGSDDVVYPRWLQLYDFSVWPVPGTQAVTVMDGVFDPSGQVVEFPYTTVDLSPYAPSGSGYSLWAIVCLDPTGQVQVYACPSGTNLTVTDICQVPYADWWELAAVKLWADDSSINMIPGYEEIIDLRFARVGYPQHGGLGSGTNWENVYIVAESGGDYDSLVSAEADAPAGHHQLLVMPGDYYENLTISTLYLGLQGIGTRYRDFHVKILGADDTGPIVTMANDCALVDIDIERTLEGGSGRFTYLDAATSGKYPKVIDCRLIGDAGATGRDVTVLEASGSGAMPAIINRCYIEVAAGGGSSYAVDAQGGDVLLENCEIYGDVVATGAGTVTLRNCFVTGDVTGTAGADLYIDLGTYISGTVSGWDSETYRPTGGAGASTFDALTDTPANKTGASLELVRVNVGETALEYTTQLPDHDHTGDTGDGDQLDHGAALTGLTDDDHTQYALNWDNVLIVSAAGGTRAPGFYNDIATAQAAGSAGDVILLLPGTYVEDVDMVEGISLVGIDRENTIIQGSGATGTAPVEYSGSVGNTLLSNVTLTQTGPGGITIVAGINCFSTGTNWVDNVSMTVTNTGGTYAFGVLQQTAAGTIYLENVRANASGATANVEFYINQAGAVMYCRRCVGATFTRVAGTMHVAGCVYTTGPGAGTATHDDAQAILDSLLTVDGSGSGLDADTVDGLETSADPGAAAKILKTTAAGLLTLEDLVITDTLGVGGVATHEDIIIINGPSSGNDNIFRIGEDALDVDLTATTIAAGRALGIMCSDIDDTPDTAVYPDTGSGSWNYSAGNGWYALVSSPTGVNEGPFLVIPLARPGNWELWLNWDYTAGVTNMGWISIAAMTASNHIMAYAAMGDFWAGASDVNVHMYTNDGDDTYTEQYAGTAMSGSASYVHGFRVYNGIISVYDDQDNAWHNLTSRYQTGVNYTPAYAVLQINRYATVSRPLISHFLTNIRLRYLLGDE